MLIPVCLLQTGQLDLRHFDPEFVREPVPGNLPLPRSFPGSLFFLPNEERPWKRDCAFSRFTLAIQLQSWTKSLKENTFCNLHLSSEESANEKKLPVISNY